MLVLIVSVIILAAITGATGAGLAWPMSGKNENLLGDTFIGTLRERDHLIYSLRFCFRQQMG